MKKCKIFTGGAPVFGASFVKEDFDGCLIIAADSGCTQIERLAQYGIAVLPDILLGDMDSFDKENALKAFPDARFFEFPPEKDYTDTQLALSVAVENGCTDIEIIGGTGSLPDTAVHFVGLQAHVLGAEGNIFIDGFLEQLVLRVLEHQTHPETGLSGQFLVRPDVLTIQQNFSGSGL